MTTTRKRAVKASSSLIKKTKKLEGSTDLSTREFENLVRSGMSNQEQEYIEEYIHMFRTLRLMTRKAGKKCMESGLSRDYYSYCTLLSQQREVISDIRTLTDLSNQSSIITTEVLQPLAQALGQTILNSFYQLKKLLKETTVSEETQFALTTLESIAKEQSKMLQQSYLSAVDNLEKIMSAN